MELITNLISQLGIDENQAKGGLASILSFAKENLDSGDFSKILGLIGGGENLLNAAPQATGIGGMLGGVVSALGAGGNLAGLASLAGQFKELNLDSDMIQKFVPVITSFLEQKGGSDITSIITKILK